MKKLGILFIFCVVFATGCDSLWNHSYDQKVSVELTIPPSLLFSVVGNTSLGNTDSSGDITAKVSLHNAKTEAIIAEQTVNLGEKLDETILFENLYIVDSTIFAKITLLQYGYEDRVEISNTIKVIAGYNELTMTFDNPQLKIYETYYVSQNGNDESFGTKEYPFATIQKAVDRIQEINDETTNYVIDITGTITNGENSSAVGLIEINDKDTPKPLNITLTGTGSIDATGLDKRVLYVRGTKTTVNLTGSLILTGGTATTDENPDGAGILISGGATVNMYGGTITSNTATEGGGVKVMDSGTFNLENGKIEQNTATNEGGGVKVDTATFTMKDGSVSSNQLLGNNSYGIGVCIRGGRFTMTKGDIQKNTLDNDNSYVYGGGIFTDSEAALDISGGNISNNTIKCYGGFGGGVHCTSSSFTIKNATINNNHITRNSAVSNGGGIYLMDNNGSIIDVEIKGNSITTADNTPTDNGGGLYSDTTTVTLENVTIKENKANKGGGCCVNSSTLTIEGGEISSNTGGVYGSGIFISGDLNLKGNPIIYNNINSNSQNNIYFTNGRSDSPIKITGALTDGANIGLSPSTTFGDYVLVMGDGYTPNAADVAKFNLDNVDNPIGLDSDNIVIKDIFETSGTGATLIKYHGRAKEVTIPDGITIIESSAFEGCSSLETVTMPDGVTTIGPVAFKDCSSLTSITIPNSVTTIESSAFKGCSRLESITIHNSVAAIGSFAFEGCSRLESIAIDSVTTIGSSAFKGCSSLESIRIPNGVTTIESSAFEGCSSLTSVTIDSATTIGSSAFEGCSSLTSVTMPNGVTTIGPSAFEGCTSLNTVTVNATNPPTLEASVFDNCGALQVIKVPIVSVDIYKVAPIWSTYATKIQANNP